ncbi:SurA N-terminal domain-containing protein [Flavobacteriales bacterium]|nr:SurA N-terminal domain-containing protein [Flavobacteriales bacterium]
MATLGNIRNRSGLLLAVIGIAMLAFIGTDFMSSLGSGGGSSSFIGEVLGEDILRQSYEVKVEEGINNWKTQNPQSILNQTITSQLRSQIWDQYVRELIMNNEFETIGIDVSDDEFFELLQGVNVHPEISKISSFQDPETGQFDRTKVLGYLKQIDQDPTGEAKTKWIGFQKYLVGLIKNSKYDALVNKAMYVTHEHAKLKFNESTQNVTFNYVAIPYTTIDDSLVSPTTKEIATYYSNHKSEYEQAASKDVDFVVFSVIPSDDDDIATKAALQDLVTDFTNYEDCALMARRNSDNTSAKFAFSTKDKLEDLNWSEIFDENVGIVIGPYLASQGVYRIAKLAASEYRPDSVEARHILISTQTISLDSVQQRIDELKLQIENGADFGNLAQLHSEDKGSAIKGGDLDWFQEGVMVDEFNEACFTSNKGDLSVVTTQFGMHLIEVTKISRKVKKAKIVFIDRNVEPSTETFNSYYSQAAQFAGKILNEGIAFDSLVANENLVKRSDSKVEHDKQSISGLPNSREMVRWMNSTNAGNVSEVFQFENEYVVAYLTKSHAEGFVPLEDIKEQITALVSKQKKATIIKERVIAADLNTIATNNNTIVVNAKQINFANLSVQGIGYEPELIGSVFGLEKGVVSKPIEGKSAIYIVEATIIDEVKTIGDFTQQQTKMQQEGQTYSNGAVYNALKSAANIKDNRSDFY